MPRQSLSLDLDGLALPGYSNFSGMPRSNGFNTPYLLAAPPAGQVAIIHKILVVSHGNTSTSPTASPGSAHLAYSFLRMTRSASNIDLFFHAFDKLPTLGTADEQAQPTLPTVWEPRMPLVVPPLWTLSGVTAGEAGTCPGVVGVYMSDHEARQLGYDCQDAVAQTGRNWIAASSNNLASSDVTLAAARTGYSIQITDVFMRLMPQTTSATITLKDSAGAVIFVYKHDNRTSPGQVVLKPNIYLADDVGLVTAASTNAINNGSIIVLGRYVRNQEKPRDRWWAYVEPTIPSPGAPADGLGNKANTTLKAAPGVGREHVVEGYYINASRDSTSPDDQVLTNAITAAITVGTPATFGAAGNTITNKALSPAILLGSQGYETDIVLDEVALRCPPNAQINWEARAILSPTGTNSHIDGWSVLIWGRTREATRASTDSSNLQGANA